MPQESSEIPQPTDDRSAKKPGVSRFIKKPWKIIRNSEQNSSNIERRSIKIEEFNPKELYGALYGWKDAGEVDTHAGAIFYCYEINGPDNQEWTLMLDQHDIDGGSLYVNSGMDVEISLHKIHAVEILDHGQEVRMHSPNGTYIIDKYNHELVAKDGSSLFKFHPPVTAASGEVKLLK